MVAAMALAGAVQARAQSAATWRVPSFGQVTIYRGSAPPRQVVLFLSGDGGWNQGVVDMAVRLRDAGALVVGIDIRTFMKTLEASNGCAYPAGALEELSRAVQLREKLPVYLRPILVGYSSGATLVYAALAAAPPETFAGGISLGFCPDIEIRTPLCHMRGLAATKRENRVGYNLLPFKGSTVPWMVLQGEIDQVCSPPTTRAFVASTGAARLFSLPQVGHGFAVAARWVTQFLDAYRAIGDAHASISLPRAVAPAVADLGLVEVPSLPDTPRDELAVIMTGDGGWADLDKSLAAGLSKAGIPVVGWSSLEYYWTPRTPDRAAADLDRIITHYTETWRKSRVLVIGYSFGADVVPFLLNRLSSGARSHVASVALLSPSRNASFEFHFSSWLGGSVDTRYPTVPEIDRLPVPLTCLYGTDEADSLCRTPRPRQRSSAVGEGHHFSGLYDRLVELILR